MMNRIDLYGDQVAITCYDTAESVRFHWDDVDEIQTYKDDLWSIDEIRLAFFTSTAEYVCGEHDKGFKALTAVDTRWSQCHIKAITLLPNVLLMQQAYEAGAIEVILLREGKAIEGAWVRARAGTERPASRTPLRAQDRDPQGRSHLGPIGRGQPAPRPRRAVVSA